MKSNPVPPIHQSRFSPPGHRPEAVDTSGPGGWGARPHDEATHRGAVTGDGDLDAADVIEQQPDCPPDLDAETRGYPGMLADG